MKPAKVFTRSRLTSGMIILLFLPVLFMNNRSSHDWGDDFAQYIHQAGNIVRGMPQSETGFVYSEENYIGPRAYPPGFPLLLSPVYALFGQRMIVFTTFISLICFLLAILVLVFYRKLFSPLTALFLTLILIYNPQFLIFKQEVMSDIPFTAFLVLAFLWYPKLKPGKYLEPILFSVLAGFLILIRSVGFVLVAAMFIDQLIVLIKNRRTDRLIHEAAEPLNKRVVLAILLTVLPLSVYFIMNTLVFRMPSGGSVSDYLAFYYTGNFLVHVPANLEQYVETLRFTYTPAIGGFRFIALITGAAFLTLSILGFIRKILTHMEVYDWFFIIYLFILLVFPNNFSAYRLLIPLGFILLYYAALGFKSIRLPSVFMGKNLVILFGTVILVLFIPGIIQVFQARNTVLEGPQEQRAAHAFRYISGNIPDSSLVVFFKPRALALYTGKQGMVDPFSNDLTAIYTQVHNAGADYILIHNELTSESMKRFVRIMKSRVELVWKNRRYQLYKIVPPDPADLF